MLVLSAGRNQPRLRQPKEAETQVIRYEPAQDGNRPFLQLVGHRIPCRCWHPFSRLNCIVP